MGLVSRFERKLEGAVGDVFARVFGGAVVPREVEQALEREIADGVRGLDGGHLLAPNRYTVTLGAADYARLSGTDAASDHRQISGELVRFATRLIAASGWQTYGDVVIDLRGSGSLHTGQFRISSSVDPDAAPAGAAAPNQPGATRMSHSNGENVPAGPGRRSEAGDQRSAWDERNGWRRDDEGADPDARGRDRAQQPAAGAQPPGAPAGSGPPPYPPPGRPDGYDGRSRSHPGNQPDARAWGQPGQYPPESYNQSYYDQREQGRYEQGRFEQDYRNQQHDQGGYQQEQYEHGGGQGGYGWDDRRELTATLHLDDGSGRTYQLKPGTTVVGRGQEAQFRLADTGVSRRHLEIDWDGQVAMLADLGSTNGTTVNEAPVQNWQLADGDVVRAGHSSIVVRLYG